MIDKAVEHLIYVPTEATEVETPKETIPHFSKPDYTVEMKRLK
jgi:hypothetical protein